MPSRSARRPLRPSKVYKRSYHTLRRGLLSLKKNGHQFRGTNPNCKPQTKFGGKSRNFLRNNHYHSQQYRYHQYKRYTKNSKTKSKLKRQKRIQSEKQKNANRAVVSVDNEMVHGHIRYFETPHDLVPQHLVPYLADIADHSTCFYYEDCGGKKCLIYAQSGECTESGEPRFVFVSCFDIDSQSVRHLDRFPCSSFFKASPLTALDRDQHILYLIGNHGDDDGKVLAFSLRTNSMISFQDRTDLNVPVSQLIGCHFEGLSNRQIRGDNEVDQISERNQSVALLNEVISSEYILRDQSPVIHYKRYLFIPKLNRLLRFGGQYGIDDTVQFVDIKHLQRMQEMNRLNPLEMDWETYPFRLPGSALTMHFVLWKNYELFVFDIKGGGEGKIWIIDLLFNDHRIERALKKVDSCFAWDFGVKCGHDWVQFINASSYGELLVNMREIMPQSLCVHMDRKTKMLVEGYCREITRKDHFDYVFPVVLVGKILSVYPPFF